MIAAVPLHLWTAHSKMKPIPLEVLECVFYDPDTGEAFCDLGSIKKSDDGFVYIHPRHGQFALARILWMLETSEDPGELYIDHIDTDPFNNIFSNLRKATPSQNQHNKSINKNNTSGVKGVHWCRRANKWRARIMVGGKCVWSKNFVELGVAAQEIADKRRELHGQFSRDR